MMTDTGGRTCLVCGRVTAPLHHSAGDYFFGSGQRADYVVCGEPGCRTVQQSPRPDAARVATFYDGYYTHMGCGSHPEHRVRSFADQYGIAG